jgi:3-methyladenine DNA glycosylase AlkD
MARFGINTENMFGVSLPELRKMGKTIRKVNALAQNLLETGIADANILASLIADLELLYDEQMEK